MPEAGPHRRESTGGPLVASRPPGYPPLSAPRGPKRPPGAEETPVAVRPREETIAVGGIKVHTLVGGQGEPLLVLHGAGGNRGWRRWMAAVAERYTVYAPTHPGFGRSDPAEWMEGIDDLARFYLWFL